MRPKSEIGRPFQASSPSWPQSVMSSPPRLRVLEKIESTCLKRETLDRVVLVGEHGQRVDRHLHLGRLVAVLLLEGVDFLGLHLAAHRAELRGAFDQGRRRGRGTLALDLDVDVRIGLLEALRPQGHQVVERVGADRIQVSGNSADRLVFRQRGIEVGSCGERGKRRKHGAGETNGCRFHFHGCWFWRTPVRQTAALTRIRPPPAKNQL